MGCICRIKLIVSFKEEETEGEVNKDCLGIITLLFFETMNSALPTSIHIQSSNTFMPGILSLLKFVRFLQNPEHNFFDINVQS